MAPGSECIFHSACALEKWATSNSLAGQRPAPAPFISINGRSFNDIWNFKSRIMKYMPGQDARVMCVHTVAVCTCTFKGPRDPKSH